MRRGDPVRRLRDRLDRFASTGDPKHVLEPAALADAERVGEFVRRSGHDTADQNRMLEGVFLVASLHWYRYQVLPAGQDQDDLRMAVRFTEALRQVAPDAVPLSMLAMLAAVTGGARTPGASPGPAAAPMAGPAAGRDPRAGRGDPQEWVAEALLVMRNAEMTGDYTAAGRAEALFAAAADATAPGPMRTTLVSMRGKAARDQFTHNGDRAALDRALAAHRAALAATPQGDGARPERLFNLGNTLTDLRKEGGAPQLLDDAIDHLRQASTLLPQASPAQAMALLNLAQALHDRWVATGTDDDIDEAIRAAVRGHQSTPDQLKSSLVLGRLRAARFVARRDDDDRDAALGAWEAVLAVPAEALPDPSYRDLALQMVATLRAQRHETDGDPDDLDTAIAAYDESGVTADPSLRAVRLFELGKLYQRRYDITGDDTDLAEANRVLDEAVDATPSDQPQRPDVLAALGIALGDLFIQAGDGNALRRAVEVLREAVALFPVDAANRMSAHANLGLSLQRLFEHTANPALLDEGLTALRTVRRTAPPGDPELPSYLVSLALMQQHHFAHTGDTAALDEAVEVLRQAVSAAPPGHRDRALCLINLGAALNRRAELDLAAPPPTSGASGDAGQAHAAAAATEAIAVLREAAALTTAVHIGQPPTRTQERIHVLSTLAIAYLLDFGRTRDHARLDEAVATTRQAVAECPRAWPFRGRLLNNLGIGLMQLAEEVDAPAGDAQENLRLAADALREAAGTVDPDHHDRTMYLMNLFAVLEHAEEAGDPAAATEALAAARAAATVESAPSPLRATAAYRWARRAERAGDDHDALTAYTLAVGLLDQVAWRGLRRDDQERLLVDFAGLASAAAACAVGAGLPEQAIELLEQGRGVLLAQTLDTRGPAETHLREVAPDLADRLSRIQEELDSATTDNPTTGGHNGSGDRRQALAHQRRELLDEIRQRPGLAHFLLPQPFAMLAPAATEGPVVVVNISERRSDALIVTNAAVRVVPLPAATTQELASRAAAFLLATRPTPPAADPVAMQHRRIADARTVADTLGWLWTAIAEPVLSALDHHSPPDGQWPRIWWCPTGLLTLLPLHAATGPAHAQAVLDRVVSSYTSTLRALLHARRDTPPALRDSVLLVALPHTPHLPDLPGAVREAAMLAERLPRLEQLTGPAATRQAVLGALARCTIVHFACHAAQDLASPTEARLQLHDGPLPLRDLLRQRSSLGELAFLSACETSRGGVKLPDEALNLAAALQLAGYRHVIGALWQVSDSLSADLADAIYADLTSADGTVAVAGTALALHTAVRAARARRGVSAERWAPYVHIGP